MRTDGIHFFDGTSWVREVETEALDGPPLHAAGSPSAFFAVTEREILRRDERDRTWASMPDEFGSGRRRLVVSAGDERVLLFGAGGAFDVHNGAHWCTVPTGSGRYLDTAAIGDRDTWVVMLDPPADFGPIVRSLIVSIELARP